MCAAAFCLGVTAATIARGCATTTLAVALIGATHPSWALRGVAEAADGAAGPETRTEAVGRPQGAVLRDGGATTRRVKR